MLDALVTLLNYVTPEYVQSTAHQIIQNCQNSPVDFQSYSLHHKAQI
jgi:hypothetical protein